MGNCVDFAAIKRSVGLALVLGRYHVLLRRSGRDQYRVRCPLHGGEGGFHANLTRNLFHCFSCGAGGTVLDFVAAMEGCTLREAALRLEQDASAGSPAAAAVGDGKQRVTKKSKVPTPLGFVLRSMHSAHPYLAARGIEQRTAAEFGVGFYRGPGLFCGRLVIPIHNQRGDSSPTAVVRWMGRSRATDFRRASPNRRSCSTSTVPPRRESER